MFLENKKSLRNFILLITYGLVLYWLLNHTAQAKHLIQSAYGVISPFVLGFCIAFVLNVVMRRLERLWDVKVRTQKFRRPVCLLLSLLLFIGVVFAVLFILIPQLKATVLSIGEMMPEYVAEIEGWWQNFSGFLSHYGAQLPQLELDVEKITSWVAELVSNVGSGVVNTTVNVTTSIVSAVVNFVLALVFAIYLLGQKENLCRQLRKVLQAFLSERWVRRLLHVAKEANRSFTNFVTGQLTEAVIIGALCFVGMLLLGMPYALAISVLVGFTALIPIFGAFIGTAVGAFLILLVNPMQALWFIVFILILQQFDGNILGPKILGDSIGLSPFWVIFAIVLGGGLFGIVGMIIGVPSFAVIYYLVKRYIYYCLNKRKTGEMTDER